MLKYYYVVTAVGVWLESYGRTSSWPDACRRLRAAQAAFPLGGCRLMVQSYLITEDGVYGG